METRTPLTRYWRDGTRSINYAVQDVRAGRRKGVSVLNRKTTAAVDTNKPLPRRTS